MLLHIYLQESGSSQFWYQKKRVSYKLFNSKFSHWQRRKRKKKKQNKANQPIDILEGNVHKDLAEDKGDKAVLGFTFYYCVNKS